MREELLHYIWQFQYFNHQQLCLSNGQEFQVIQAGKLNQDAGPDFFNGLILMDGVKWAGNIEVHVKSSEWKIHKHHEDPQYNKVILHVVWEDDQPVRFSDGKYMPTIVLKGRVHKAILEKYARLKKSRNWLPCQNFFQDVPLLIKQQALDRSLVERLEEKSNRLNQILVLNKNDWEATLYQLLAKYFGFKVNAVPFELLAASLPFAVLRKHQQNELQLTALIFGQAGMLSETHKGSYPQDLWKEYQFLMNKYQLKPLESSLWKFMRMRPANFPTIRLAQFTNILSQNVNLFQRTIEAENIYDLRKLYRAQAGEYWSSHYRFDVPAARKVKKQLGKTSIDILIINVVVPLLFNYAGKTGREDLKEKAQEFLQELPAEKNTIVNKWKSLNLPIESAYDSQAALQLKTTYCDRKNCLNCTVGNSILKAKHD